MLDREARMREREMRRKQVFIFKIILSVILVVFICLMVVITSALKSGYALNSANVISVHYSGYNGKATAELQIDKEKLKEELENAYNKYKRSLWPLVKKRTVEDYLALADTVTGELDKTEGICNGDVLFINMAINQDMAKALKVSLKYEEIPLTVSDISEATVLGNEELFADVVLEVEGISPMLSVGLKNNSQDELLKQIGYEIVEPKDFYAKGDTVTVKAVVDREAAVLARIQIEEADCVKTYTVDSDIRYIDSTADIPPEKLAEAIEKGKDAFVAANEYGLRIFTEAGLPYTWEGTKDYTFKWSNPRIISSYVETLKEEYRGGSGKTFNYLELAYEIHISQANGVGCDAEAVVCFDNMTIKDDGTIDLNEESAQLYTASYLDKNIKDSLKGWFGDEYELDKFDLSLLPEK